ncbi:hypothetical protein [Rhodococcoides yunnanense]|uniref:hypothetical protein n=1 Tax=Rhodococcoides yunnanense TaxID=278209 RepID=UPI00093562EF|nr:hypothetical protein [Rhodococcus yunnanensis]
MTDHAVGSDSAALHRAEIAALAELSSPEAVKAFALVRNRLRPGEINRFDELLETVNRLSGPGFEDAASAELRDALHSTRTDDDIRALAHSIDEPIGALALAQVLRGHGQPS